MIYISKTGRTATEKYMQFVHKGLPNSVLTSYDQILAKTDIHEVWLFGILRGTNLLYEHAEKNKINFFYMDRPYWGESRKPPYLLRIVKNNHVKNFMEQRPDDRFKKYFPWEIKKYHRNGKKILVCPPTESISTFFNCGNWLERTVAKLKNHTDRELIVRGKPYNPTAYKGLDGKIHTGQNVTDYPKEKIEWSQIHAVVTNNSSITIKALANGVPVFTDENNCAFPIAGKRLDDIENPEYHDPRPLFYSLSYGQFTADEMEKDYPRKVINGR